MNSHLRFVAPVTLTAALTVCWLFSLAALAHESDAFRTWTDSTGKFKIEARFEKFEKGKVHLKRKDNGKMLVVSSAKLSKTDQAFFRKILADRKKREKSAASRNTPSSGAASPTGPSGVMVWRGTWNNRKFGTKGPLICTAAVKDDKTWQAVFSGTGIGKPFKYEVTISTNKKNGQTLLQGTSSVDGDTYRWSGKVQGKTLAGRYRSASGNNGEFQLQEAPVKNAARTPGRRGS